MPPEAAAAADPVGPAREGLAGVGDVGRALWEDLRGALAERLKLLTLEARLAGLTLVQLVIHAVIVAVLVVTSWIGLMGGVVVALTGAGLHWAVALGLGIVINLVVAALLVRAMLRMVDRVGLPASLRRFQKH